MADNRPSRGGQSQQGPNPKSLITSFFLRTTKQVNPPPPPPPAPPPPAAVENVLEIINEVEITRMTGMRESIDLTRRGGKQQRGGGKRWGGATLVVRSRVGRVVRRPVDRDALY